MQWHLTICNCHFYWRVPLEILFFSLPTVWFNALAFLHCTKGSFFDFITVGWVRFCCVFFASGFNFFKLVILNMLGVSLLNCLASALSSSSFWIELTCNSPSLKGANFYRSVDSRSLKTMDCVLFFAASTQCFSMYSSPTCIAENISQGVLQLTHQTPRSARFLSSLALEVFLFLWLILYRPLQKLSLATLRRSLLWTCSRWWISRCNKVACFLLHYLRFLDRIIVRSTY